MLGRRRCQRLFTSVTTDHTRRSRLDYFYGSRALMVSHWCLRPVSDTRMGRLHHKTLVLRCATAASHAAAITIYFSSPRSRRDNGGAAVRLSIFYYSRYSGRGYVDFFFVDGDSLCSGRFGILYFASVLVRRHCSCYSFSFIRYVSFVIYYGSLPVTFYQFSIRVLRTPVF